MPFEDAPGVNNDSLVLLRKKNSVVRVGPGLLGRVLDGAGEPIDGKGPLQAKGLEERGLYHAPSHPLERSMIREPLDLGVRAINGLLTCGKGQRVGIMAGSGVGKSVLLGMMARNTRADVNVIALIGERGREVREFVEKDLGPEGLARSVVIVATSDKSPLLRMRAAFLAATVAEYFRDQQQDVLFLMDSVTRFCMAQREIGLSLGEPPASKGYTPSVFSMLPKLLERAGTGVGQGSITGLFTVLVDGDDMDEPIADAARSILDGHIVLSRKIAQKNHFPALDVLQSTSRVMRAVSTKDHLTWAGQLREWLALYNQAEDLINIGAYSRGVNPKLDQAIHVIDRINAFLRQGVDERSDFAAAQSLMQSICLAAEVFSAQQGARK
jgi:flagellum-specific ATP synthase